MEAVMFPVMTTAAAAAAGVSHDHQEDEHKDHIDTETTTTSATSATTTNTTANGTFDDSYHHHQQQQQQQQPQQQQQNDNINDPSITTTSVVSASTTIVRDNTTGSTRTHARNRTTTRNSITTSNSNTTSSSNTTSTSNTTSNSNSTSSSQWQQRRSIRNLSGDMSNSNDSVPNINISTGNNNSDPNVNSSSNSNNHTRARPPPTVPLPRSNLPRPDAVLLLPTTTTTTTLASSSSSLPSFFASTKPKPVRRSAVVVVQTVVVAAPPPRYPPPPSPREPPWRVVAADDNDNDPPPQPQPLQTVQAAVTAAMNRDDAPLPDEDAILDEHVVAVASHRYSFFADQSFHDNHNNHNVNMMMNLNDDDDADDPNDNKMTCHTHFVDATSIAIVPSIGLHHDDDDDHNHHNTSNDDDHPVWEEEATPQQTQFAKRLLLARQPASRPQNDDDDENHNDVSSTASEHGSLLRTDPDDDDDPDHEPDDDNGADQISHLRILPTTNDKRTTVPVDDDDNDDPVNASNSTYYQTPPQVLEEEEEVDRNRPPGNDDDDDPDDNIGHTDDPDPTVTTTMITKATQPITAGPTTTTTTAVVVTVNDHDATTATTNPDHDESHFRSSFDILKKWTGTATTSFTATNNSVSQSAPTTPRTSTTWYNNHYKYNNNSNDKNQGSIETKKPPSSFLLRSPGSIVHQSVATGKNSIHHRMTMRTTTAPTDDAPYTNSPIASWLGGGSQSTLPKLPSDNDNHTTVTTKENADRPKTNSSTDIFQRPKAATTNAFHLVARSCFSFDAYDTSMDDHYECTMPPNDHRSIITAGGTIATASTSIDDVNTFEDSNHFKLAQRRLPIPELDHPTVIQKSTSSRPLSIFKRPPEIGYSASWDVSSTTTSTYSPSKTNRNLTTRSANHNTATSGRSSTATDYRRMFRPHANHQRPSFSTTTTSSLSSPKRSVPNYDDPHRSADDDCTQQLKSPQRIEIERNDAIDILACLVERGVSWKQPTSQPQEPNGTPFEHVATNEQLRNESPPFDSGDNDQDGDDDYDDDDVPSPADIVAIVAELQGLSLAEENIGNYNSKNTVAHQKRKLALEELVRSHEYAMEMKRASQSASSWLKSIGRSQTSTSPTKTASIVVESTSPARNVILSESATPTTCPNSPNSREDHFVVAEETTIRRGHRDQAAGEDSSASAIIDVLTLKAMLHSSQIEAKEKSDLADRLNEELAKCRAEIGRLKSSAQSMSFRSPNRSILDESDDGVDDDEEECDDVNGGDKSQKTDPTRIFESDRIILDDNDCLDSSFLREDAGIENDNVDMLELERYKAALTEANTIIRHLHTNLQKYDKAYDDTTVPFVALPDHVNANENMDSTNRRDNFTTDWVDLDPPLPYPPDHDIESPIVTAVLDLWTSDGTLQKSFLNWIDQVLVGIDADTIPPLTLSNLDHQARDGFVLHLLPLLLRRPDILVDVKTRVNHRTTCDLAVSISPTISTSEVRHPMESTSEHSNARLDDINSSAATAHITNTAFTSINSHTEEYSEHGTARSMTDKIPAMSRLSYDEMAEDIALSDTSQPGLLSSLGGALGGLLLARNRNGAVASSSPSSSSSATATTSEPSYLVVPPSSRRSIMNGTNMPTIMESPKTAVSDTQPSDDVVRFVELDYDSNNDYHNVGSNRDQLSSSSYHRVVSAPPGRIGVTFVDYRGHCMVSDVNHDSPLIGWIFPSDVLIAIDHIPVSGLPIRDIIKLLKDRDHNSQRALRVISSHAMNELTLNVNHAT